MRGVKFGNFHTAEDWSLILNAKTLEPPKPKTVYISVPGRDGDIDLSETLTDEIKYENRNASYTFLATEGSYQERQALFNDILGVVHGRKLNIIDPDYPEKYLVGRCSVGSVQNNKAYGTIVISCVCDPWLYSITDVTRSISVSNETKSIILVNEGIKTVTPSITVTGSIVLTFNGGASTVALSDGSYKVTELRLKTGNNLIEVQGSGTVGFTYKEGSL